MGSERLAMASRFRWLAENKFIHITTSAVLFVNTFSINMYLIALNLQTKEKKNNYLLGICFLVLTISHKIQK